MARTIQTTEEAIQTVRDNNLDYFECALMFAVDWVPKQMKPFTSEDFKKEFYKSGFPEPDEPRVFGAVFRELSRLKKIYKTGFRESENPVCHSRPQSIWISHQYRLKQQGNALADKNALTLF